MSIDPKKSANCRKGKEASPWGWYPHVQRTENYKRNYEFKQKAKKQWPPTSA